MSKLFIVSNRLPVSVVKREKSLRFHPSTGGLATGLDSMLSGSIEAKWIGWPGIALEKIDTSDDLCFDRIWYFILSF